MADKFVPEPIDLLTWLARVDVNGLSNADAQTLANVDIEDDAQLDALVTNWIRPWFLLHSETSKRSMRDVLAASDRWSSAELREVFDDIGFPSQQQIKDIPRFLAALKRAAQE